MLLNNRSNQGHPQSDDLGCDATACVENDARFKPTAEDLGLRPVGNCRYVEIAQNTRH